MSDLLNTNKSDLKMAQSLQKMLGDVCEERKIDKFPTPFSLSSTPYVKIDFSDITRRVCETAQSLVPNSLRICKVILLGDVCVGKTCLVNRFCHNVYDSHYKATIGVDFDVEKFQILSHPFTLQIWDTAGQERFKSIAQSYYRKAHVIVLVFDVTNISSLGNCRTWLKEALDVLENETFVFLIGTKIDLLSQASFKVVESYAIKFAKEIHAEFWPCSPKTNENITYLFHRIAALSFDRHIMAECETSVKKIAIGKAPLSIKACTSSNNSNCFSNCSL